jgi:hypothetical protein
MTWSEKPMATRRLTAEERRLLKQRVNERQHARYRRITHTGLAERCYQAAKGDPWLALWLAIEMTRKGIDVRCLPQKRSPSPRRRITFEELMSYA